MAGRAGGAVLWLIEAVKNLELPTNRLATNIAPRLHAGPLPDDTLNGRALIAGEAPKPSGHLAAPTSPGNPVLARQRQCSSGVGLRQPWLIPRTHVAGSAFLDGDDDRVRDVVRRLVLPEAENQPSALTKSLRGVGVPLGCARPSLPSSSRWLSRQCGDRGNHARSIRR